MSDSTRTRQAYSMRGMICELRDWRQAGLHQLSFFRLFPVTLLQRDVRVIGRLSDADWASVRTCFQAGFGGD
jgi:hypothetical protein